MDIQLTMGGTYARTYGSGQNLGQTNKRSQTHGYSCMVTHARGRRLLVDSLWDKVIRGHGHTVLHVVGQPMEQRTKGRCKRKEGQERGSGGGAVSLRRDKD